MVLRGLGLGLGFRFEIRIRFRIRFRCTSGSGLGFRVQGVTLVRVVGVEDSAVRELAEALNQRDRDLAHPWMRGLVEGLGFGTGGLEVWSFG